jgi:uncharacterized protein (DUF58 family)
MTLVPESRLLFWFAVVALPFSVLGALYPVAGPFAVVLIAGLLVLALVDAAVSYGRLDGIRVQLPEVLRLSKDRAGSIEVTLKNELKKPLRLRLGLALPRELASPHEDATVLLPAGAEQSRLDWPVTPLRRGNFRLRRAFLETASRLGFWVVRANVPAVCEARVYPNLLTERRTLAALFLNRGAFGIHAQRQVGKGRDFEKLREYIPGDGYDEIHWKATAKRGHPVTKIFQIERTQEVYVVIDASRLSARKPVPSSEFRVPSSGAKANPEPGTRNQELRKRTRNADLGTATANPEPETTILERFITAALILAQAAEKQGDLFGLLTFTDKADTFLRAKNGKQHYAACRDALYTLEPRSITPDFDEISSFIRMRLRRRALLIFLTSLDDPVLAESFVRNMALLAGQHLVLVNMIKPPGVDPLFTNGDVQHIDDVYRHLGGHLRWHNLRELEKVLQRRGVSFKLLENEKLAADLVAQYLGVKQRQLI